MKKTLQKIAIDIPAGETVFVSDVLKQEYTNCDSIFSIIGNKTVDVSKLTLGVKIDGAEILPSDTDLSLILFNGMYPLKDAVYHFSGDNIPARSSQIEIAIKNTSTAGAKVFFYCVLTNR